ncbi:hypothetical protein F8S12_12895 [Nostoc sp. WHI]|nr:hypothetical protein [Nostoc sp. WHI]
MRYPNGYRHWDCAGDLANQLLGLFPGLVVDDGDPSNVTMSHDEHQIKLRYGVEGATVEAASLDEHTNLFEQYAAPFFALVFRSFAIKTTSRVGHRLVNHLTLDDKASVQDYIFKLSIKTGAGGSFFASSEDERLNTKKTTGFILIFEDEKIGLRINIGSGKAKTNINGPMLNDLRRHIPPPTDIVVLDIDNYTLKPLNISDLLINDLAKSNAKMVKTRILPILEI